MKSFPVSKMPWHTDDHKFGEAKGVTQRELEELLKPLPPPPIDKDLNSLRTQIDNRVRSVSTVFLVDEGRCRVCGDEAVYAYLSKLYCPACWLAFRDDRKPGTLEHWSLAALFPQGRP